MSIVYLFYKVFIIFINYGEPTKLQLIKGSIKGCLENSLMALVTAQPRLASQIVVKEN